MNVPTCTWSSTIVVHFPLVWKYCSATNSVVNAEHSNNDLSNQAGSQEVSKNECAISTKKPSTTPCMVASNSSNISLSSIITNTSRPSSNPALDPHSFYFARKPSKHWKWISTRKCQEQILNAPLPQAQDRQLHPRSSAMPTGTEETKIRSGNQQRFTHARSYLSAQEPTNGYVRDRLTSQPRQPSNRKGGGNRNRSLRFQEPGGTRGLERIAEIEPSCPPPVSLEAPRSGRWDFNWIFGCYKYWEWRVWRPQICGIGTGYRRWWSTVLVLRILSILY
jgi:hypothetical protein